MSLTNLICDLSNNQFKRGAQDKLVTFLESLLHNLHLEVPLELQDAKWFTTMTDRYKTLLDMSNERLTELDKAHSKIIKDINNLIGLRQDAIWGE